MAQPEFRMQQWEARYAPHVAPINHLVDELCQDPHRGWAPYVAPIFGGVNARMLSILRDPGPATQESRFLSIENDDPTAEAEYWFLDGCGIHATDMVPWNAYPWYINAAPSPAQLDVGVEPLRRIVGMAHGLRVVMLHGGSARKSWKRLTDQHENLVQDLRLEVIETYHTSPQAFRHPSETVRDARRQHLCSSMNMAAAILRVIGRTEPAAEDILRLRGAWRSLHGINDKAGEEAFVTRVLGQENLKPYGFRHRFSQTRPAPDTVINGDQAVDGTGDGLLFLARPNTRHHQNSSRFQVWAYIREHGPVGNAAIAAALSIDMRTVRDCTKKLCINDKARVVDASGAEQ